MLVSLVAAVGIPLGLIRRWETFRAMSLRHVTSAADHARLSNTYFDTAEGHARSAELAETMAEKLGRLRGAEQRTIAQEDRRHEREARDQMESHRSAMLKELDREIEYRRRW
jgi:hypothetical protein